MSSISSTSGVLLSSSSLSDYKEEIQDYLDDYENSISGPITTLKTKKDTYTSQKTAITELSTKLKTLQSSLDQLTSTSSTSVFKSNSISLSSTDNLTATATGTAVEGNYSINVKQLAKNDKVISSSLSNEGTTDLKAGEHTFNIAVGSDSYDVTFTVSEGDTNADVLQNMMDAINNSDASANVTASLVQDSESTTRLVISSNKTGSKNAISLTDKTDQLQKLGIKDKREQSSDTDGGYLYADSSELDAIIKVDGIQITRSSNSISDAIKGVTLNLKSVQKSTDSNATLNVSLGTDNIKSTIDTFMTNYNSVISYLNEKVSVTDDEKSIFSGDTTIMSLRQKLRSMIVGKVSSVDSGAPSSLASIGIKVNSNGTLEWDDTAKFNDALQDGVSNISNLFNSTSGLATSLSTFVKTYTKTGGVLANKTTNITEQISNIEDRIETTQARIDKKVEKVTTDYEELLSSIVNLQNQQSLMNQISSYYS